MIISLIVAMTQNGVIGKDNQIPWHIPEDLKHFKEITMGHPIIMGRKTFESIGKALPGRKNIVLTRALSYNEDGVVVVHNFEQALREAKDHDKEVFVIGGRQVYELALPQADQIYLTTIDRDFDGDTYFPRLDFKNEFEVLEESDWFDSKKGYSYRFQKAVRRKRSVT
jgi:dihydrofolate reductase